MNRRERILAGAALVLALLAAARWVQLRWQGLGDQHALQLAAILQKSESLEEELVRAESMYRLLDTCRKRSLPSDPDVALGLYKQWLQQQLAKCSLEEVNLASRASPARDGRYHVLTMRVHAKGSVEQVVRFLHGFYEADLLHKLRTLSLRAGGPGSDKLDVQFEIEAISLPDALAKDSLPVSSSRPLRRESMEEYVQAIVSRGPFAPHEAKPAPTLGRNVFVSGFLDGGDRPQVWLQLRGSGQTLRLTEGEPFTAEGLSGTVRSIDARGRSVEIETEHGPRQLTLGQELAEK